MTTISQLPKKVLLPHSHADGNTVIVTQLVSGKELNVGDVYMEQTRTTRAIYYRYYKITKKNKVTMWCVPVRSDGSLIPDREPTKVTVMARRKVLSVRNDEEDDCADLDDDEVIEVTYYPDGSETVIKYKE